MARATTSGPHNQVHHIERKQRKPLARNAANARERSRMRILSRAFSRLKTALPWVPPDTKLSKLDTLRLASSYIAHLRHILTVGTVEESEEIFHMKNNFMNLSWPFAANHLNLWVGEKKTSDGGEDGEEEGSGRDDQVNGGSAGDDRTTQDDMSSCCWSQDRHSGSRS